MGYLYNQLISPTEFLTRFLVITWIEDASFETEYLVMSSKTKKTIDV